MNTTEIGIVIGVFQMIQFIASPIFGKYMSRVGTKNMYCGGILLCGLSTIVFGFTNLLPGSIFFWASLFVRCLTAVGGTCFCIAGMAMSAKCVPEYVSTVMDIMETSIGLGYTLGPMVGSALYVYGGFQLPFLCMGITLFLITFVSYWIIEGNEDERLEPSARVPLFAMPETWLSSVACFITSFSFEFYDATLADHLAVINSSSMFVGLMCLLVSASYLISAPFCGLIVDHFRCCELVMLVGSSVAVIALLVLGPSPIFTFQQSLFSNVFAFILLGISCTATYIPTFQNTLMAIKERGLDDSLETCGRISGVMQSGLALGGFMGIILGAVSVENFGFPLTSSFVAGGHLLFSSICLTFIIRKRAFQKPQKQ